jgi:tripartite-type tricarboxylate transporter receptor subunit TctC
MFLLELGRQDTMNLHRRKFLHLAMGSAALAARSRQARAQTYPARPITLIVPFPAGGLVDLVARSVAEGMRASLGRPIVIENMAGANGATAVGRGARAAPDGYTLISGAWNTHVGNGALYTLQYDILNDFEPISLLASSPMLIVARKSLPADDLNGLIGWLKANPDKASQGTLGVGSPPHLLGVLFQNITGTRFQFVPYRGTPPAMQDVMGGQIDLLILPAAVAAPQVQAGRLKAYAVTANGRLAVAPNIPTVSEVGFPELSFLNWVALWTPKGTPAGVIAKLNAAVSAALAEPAARSRISDLGMEVFPPDQQTPEALRAFQKAEVEKWWPVIKAANIKGE